MNSVHFSAGLMSAMALVVVATMTAGLYLMLRKPEWAAGRRIARAFLAVNATAVAACLIWAIVAIAGQGTALAVPAEGLVEAASGGIAEALRKGLGYIGMGISTGCAAIGAGVGVGIAGAAGIGAISEKPEMLGRSLIYIGLAEGVAIYGLLISFLIYGKVL